MSTGPNQLTTDREDLLLSLTTTIVAAHAPRVSSGELPDLIKTIYGTLASQVQAQPAIAETERPKPAVNPKRSVHDDYIICLENGKKFKSLKRHLMTHYGMTPDQYREKWGLDANYPMVAPSYAVARSSLAKKMGLGKKRRQTIQ